MNDLQLHERHRKILDRLLAAHVPSAEVWAYGSRVTGGAHDGSDLDIVIRNLGNLDEQSPGKFDLIEAIEASTLPILIDVSDWADLPDWLRADITRQHVVIRSHLQAI